MSRDPRCCICADAMGTQHICPTCREDPANADWVEEPLPEIAVYNLTPSDACVSWGEARPWEPSPLFRAVARLLVLGYSQRVSARQAGCSRAFVRKVAAELGL